MNQHKEFTPLREYIAQTWEQLKREPKQLLQAAEDSKLPRKEPPWPVYVSKQENIEEVYKHLKQVMSAEDFAQIELRQLPDDATALQEHGLLYLPYSYVVPGGRFNEMYGWDSFWIVLGLLHDGKIELAKNMVDNFLYEISHYHRVLNANRTYYLGRAQPPFLTGMILKVYEQTRDIAWLRSTVPAIEKFYAYWTEPEYKHITPTGLSRYYDLGAGPAPEVLGDERDAQGRTHYERVKEYFRTHPDADYGYDLSPRFYDATSDSLTDLFYVADRSMRESGFDPSDHFGRFNLGVIDSNPVCLNTLLYLMERETAQILEILGEHEKAHIWHDRARLRHTRIDTLLWDEDAGLYLDHNFVNGSRRNDLFATTFYPLFAGISSKEQARKVVANLHLLEAPGGLKTSTTVSGCQWDAPWGFPPLQLIAVKGLRNYGYDEQADRISVNFLSLVLKEFVEHGVIFEKYDVVQQSIGTAAAFGYTYNVVGFGWTNGTCLEMLADLP